MSSNGMLNLHFLSAFTERIGRENTCLLSMGWRCCKRGFHLSSDDGSDVPQHSWSVDGQINLARTKNPTQLA